MLTCGALLSSRHVGSTRCPRLWRYSIACGWWVKKRRFCLPAALPQMQLVVGRRLRAPGDRPHPEARIAAARPGLRGDSAPEVSGGGRGPAPVRALSVRPLRGLAIRPHGRPHIATPATRCITRLVASRPGAGPRAINASGVTLLGAGFGGAPPKKTAPRPSTAPPRDKSRFPRQHPARR